MSAQVESLEKMMAVWNTTDPEEKAALVEASMEHNVHFADPTHNIIGREAFIAMVHKTHKRFPGAVYSRASRVDVQNNFCRYHWEIHLDGKLLVEGFDVSEINDHGKVVKVLGFFGELSKEPG